MKTLAIITGLLSLFFMAVIAPADELSEHIVNGPNTPASGSMRAPASHWYMMIQIVTGANRGGPALDSLPVASLEVCTTLADHALKNLHSAWDPIALCMNTQTGETHMIKYKAR